MPWSGRMDLCINYGYIIYVEKYKTGWYFDRKNKRMLNY